jgi:hypothetical protein
VDAPSRWSTAQVLSITTTGGAVILMNGPRSTLRSPTKPTAGRTGRRQRLPERSAAPSLRATTRSDEDVQEIEAEGRAGDEQHAPAGIRPLDDHKNHASHEDGNRPSHGAAVCRSRQHVSAALKD